jgi:hypothetical protein
MGYNSPALGFFGVDDVAEASAVVSGASKLISSVSNMFGGGAKTDAERQQRANFFRDAAKLGSVTAARYLLGGMQNTASHEVPYYQAAINDLKSTATGQAALNQASIQGPLWAAGIPDPGGTQSMVNNVKLDLQALSVSAPAGTMTPAPSQFNPTPSIPYPTSTIGGAHPLPAMTTTAPFNYTPWLIGGGALVAAMLLRKQ